MVAWEGGRYISDIISRTCRPRSVEPSVRHVEILCLVVILWTSLYYSIRPTDSNDIFEILIFGHFDHFWPLGRSKVVIFKKLSNIIDQGLIRSQIGRWIWIYLQKLNFLSFWPLWTSSYGQKWSFFKFY